MALALLIVDDHEDFRHLTRSMLDGGAFVVTGEAEDGETALELIERERPDVVLLDINLPDLDGFEVAERVAHGDHPPRVVLTSSRGAADYGARLLSSPVRGFIPKYELSSAALSALVAPAV